MFRLQNLELHSRCEENSAKLLQVDLPTQTAGLTPTATLENRCRKIETNRINEPGAHSWTWLDPEARYMTKKNTFVSCTSLKISIFSFSHLMNIQSIFGSHSSAWPPIGCSTLPSQELCSNGAASFVTIFNSDQISGSISKTTAAESKFETAW